MGINTASPKSSFEVAGSFGAAVTSVTNSTTLDATQNVIICNNAGTPINITLPTATTCTGRIYTIKRGTSTSNVTILTTSSQTIDGAATLVLAYTNESTVLLSNGTEWNRIGSNNSSNNSISNWGLTGNASTSPATNYIGTTDAQPMVIKTNNIERIRVLSDGTMGINTATPKSSFEVTGSFGETVTSVTGNTTLDATHSVVICNNTATPITITLPTVTTCSGRIYTIKRGTSTSTVTIATTSAQTIDGSTTLALSYLNESALLFSNGIEWKRIGANNSSSNSMTTMGEINYFNMTGTAVAMNLTTTDGTTNMYKLNPGTTLVNYADFGNGGADNGRLQYLGPIAKTFHIACTFSLTAAGNNQTYLFAMFKNGVLIPSSRLIQKLSSAGDAQCSAMHVSVSMAYGDYIELYGGNTTAGNGVTIKSLNIFALGM